jgi:hypothetical protein
MMNVIILREAPFWILSATASDEKRASLAKWKAKVGDVEADRIKNTAATRGTFMHSYLEHHLNGQGLLDLSDEGASGEEHGTNYNRQRIRGFTRNMGQ